MDRLYSHDQEMLRRLFPDGEMPDDIEPAMIALYQNGSDADAGRPLGMQRILEVVHGLGHTYHHNWEIYPPRSIRVEANVGTVSQPQWKPGLFEGFVMHGTLAIKLDGVNEVAECLQRNVRILLTEVSPKPKRSGKKVLEEVALEI